MRAGARHWAWSGGLANWTAAVEGLATQGRYPGALLALQHMLAHVDQVAARDAGDPARVPPAPAVDLAGTPRPFGARANLGAYEWAGSAAYLPQVVGKK